MFEHLSHTVTQPLFYLRLLVTYNTPSLPPLPHSLPLPLPPDRSQFATGGKDTVVSVCDESTKKNVQSMSGVAGFGK
jgi:hypothetical protein